MEGRGRAPAGRAPAPPPDPWHKNIQDFLMAPRESRSQLQKAWPSTLRPSCSWLGRLHGQLDCSQMGCLHGQPDYSQMGHLHGQPDCSQMGVYTVSRTSPSWNIYMVSGLLPDRAST